MKDLKVSHYEHIESLSKEFFEHCDGLPVAEITGQAMVIFSIRAMLAIAQQLSVISQTLKSDRGLND